MLYRYTFSSLLGKYLRVKLLKHSIVACLTFKETTKWLPKICKNSSFFFHFLTNIWCCQSFFFFFYYSHVCVMVSLVLFSCFRGFLNFYFQNPLGGIFMKLFANMYACLHFHEDRIYINFTFLNTVPHLLKC